MTDQIPPGWRVSAYQNGPNGPMVFWDYSAKAWRACSQHNIRIVPGKYDTPAAAVAALEEVERG